MRLRPPAIAILALTALRAASLACDSPDHHHQARACAPGVCAPDATATSRRPAPKPD